ncbi:MAG TPA: amidase, partial [Acidobacteriota bacterium]|nr:amidase [Acidobacteriota bacterium]
GTETWGSIVSPSTRCGTTGLRPSYGRISRSGAMALSWSMDKVGPISRSVEDCAIVFNALYGPDGKDLSIIDVPFNYTPEVKMSDLKIGYLKTDFEKEKADKDRKEEDDQDTSKANDEATLAKLRSMGVDLIAVELPHLPVNDLALILSAEAGAAFEEITRSRSIDLMKRQVKDAWPNAFRMSRFIPAVEYINANRIRYLLIQEMAETLKDIDVYVAPSVEGDNLLLTNLTGQPCVVVPNGFKKDGTPTSVTFCGKLFDEAKTLAVAKAYQDATDFHLKHPELQQ